MAGLVVGVDGGQTSTRAALATVDGDLLGEGVGGGLIHMAAEGGRGQFVKALGEAVAAMWRAANLPPQPVGTIALGLSGVDSGTPEDAEVRGLLPALITARQTIVQNDGVAALYGAHGGQPGVIVISGTGTIAWGMDAGGNLAKASGWGWLLGDAGSACAIGRDGLIAALAAFDGTGPDTALRDLFLAHFNVASLSDAKRLVYASDFGARGFAALAPIVSEAGTSGDVVARSIISDAGLALAASAAAVVRKLHFGGADVRVAPVGGAFEHVAGLTETFAQALTAQNVRTTMVSPQWPPVRGALIIAQRASDST
jgi:N-acetylglucosamine kinase-like BadF-type ATPase